MGKHLLFLSLMVEWEFIHSLLGSALYEVIWVHVAEGEGAKTACTVGMALTYLTLLLHKTINRISFPTQYPFRTWRLYNISCFYTPWLWITGLLLSLRPFHLKLIQILLNLLIYIWRIKILHFIVIRLFMKIVCALSMLPFGVEILTIFLILQVTPVKVSIVLFLLKGSVFVPIHVLDVVALVCPILDTTFGGLLLGVLVISLL